MSGVPFSSFPLRRTQATESGLCEHLQLVRGVGGARQGVFLRAETMHGTFAYLSELDGPPQDGRYNFQSHGESFLEFLRGRAGVTGLWVFDEPESALSFTACMALLGQVLDLVAHGSQVVLSTHSPLLAALPGPAGAVSPSPGTLTGTTRARGTAAARPLLAHRADTLLWLDLPFWTVAFPRVVRRTVRRSLRREELWSGNREAPLRSILTDREHLIRWAVATRKNCRKRIPAVARTTPRLRVVRLRSSREARAWLAATWPHPDPSGG